MLHKMGGYLACCHGNTSSPRHHGSVGVAARLAEDRQECDTQHDNLDTTPAAHKHVLVKWSNSQHVCYRKHN